MWVPEYMRQGHGTDARARRHWRDGEKPLEKFCVPCLMAHRLAKQERAEAKCRREAETGIEPV
jgi:hypothetical protein